MTVKGPKLQPQTLLGTMDQQARETAGHAKDLIAPVVRGQTPRKSGQVEQALRPKVRRTSTGAAVVVAPPRAKRHSPGNATIADVIRYLERGTGQRRDGPGAKDPIRATPRRSLRRGALNVYGRKVRSVKGQRPRPFMADIHQVATLRFERAARDGAADAMRAAARRLKGPTT